MDADWAKERALTLREKNDMFQGRWRGHPGNYTNLWSGLIKGCNVINAEASISEDMQKFYIDGKREKADLVFSTLPLGKGFDFIHTAKVFVGLKHRGKIMPSYANSFPNNYNFTRIMDYKQFFVDSKYTLLDFAFSWNEKHNIADEDMFNEVEEFIRKNLKLNIKDLWIEKKKFTYPLHNKNSKSLLDKKYRLCSKSNIIPLGRCGIHAYVSTDIGFLDT